MCHQHPHCPAMNQLDKNFNLIQLKLCLHLYVTHSKAFLSLKKIVQYNLYGRNLFFLYNYIFCFRIILKFLGIRVCVCVCLC